MRILFPGLAMLVLLSSCGSPPAPPLPPAVDATGRRPANSGVAVALQVCRGDLQDAQLTAARCEREVATPTALAGIEARRQVLAAWGAGARSVGNSIYSVRFEFGSARADIPDDLGHAMVREARTAPLVVLRGRTDGERDSVADGRVARERAVAVRDFLVAAGVEPARIRSTYQPAGDHVADNRDASGRALNRRVEIEIYRAMPVAVSGGGEP